MSVFAFTDFVSDVSWTCTLWIRADLIEKYQLTNLEFQEADGSYRITPAETYRSFFWAALFGIVVPFLCQTYAVAKLIGEASNG